MDEYQHIIRQETNGCGFATRFCFPSGTVLLTILFVWQAQITMIWMGEKDDEEKQKKNRKDEKSGGSRAAGGAAVWPDSLRRERKQKEERGGG